MNIEAFKIFSNNNIRLLETSTKKLNKLIIEINNIDNKLIELECQLNTNKTIQNINEEMNILRQTRYKYINSFELIIYDVKTNLYIKNL